MIGDSMCNEQSCEGLNRCRLSMAHHRCRLSLARHPCGHDAGHARHDELGVALSCLEALLGAKPPGAPEAGGGKPPAAFPSLVGGMPPTTKLLDVVLAAEQAYLA